MKKIFYNSVKTRDDTVVTKVVSFSLPASFTLEYRFTVSMSNIDIYLDILGIFSFKVRYFEPKRFPGFTVTDLSITLFWLWANYENRTGTKIIEQYTRPNKIN